VNAANHQGGPGGARIPVISAGGAVPDAVLAAFWDYERALADDDLTALDDAFVDDPGALRGDAAGLLVGHEQISAFRGARGGAPRRTIRELHARVLGPDHVVLVAVNEPLAGGAGLVTQVWQNCPDGRWRIAVAQVAGPAPAADPRIWRLVGHPLVPASAPGVLDGASVAVKDLFAVNGFAVGAGNPAYLAEAVPVTEHAAAVRTLLEAGAQIRGIARTDEFAFSIAGANTRYGTPPNPRAPLRLPGGSSNGPASAVAMGHADLGLGTDTAGSIRVPASYQGLWGLRTTHGAVSRDGLLALAPSFDTVGWLTRTPDLLARAAQVSLDPGTVPPAASGRFVVCPTLLEMAHPSVRAAFTAALDSWIRRGALPAPDRVELSDAPQTVAAFRTVQGAEAWREHGSWITKHPDCLAADIAARFAWAATITATQEAEARAVLARVRAQIDDALEDSILLLPATPTAAPLRNADAAEIDAVRSATVTLTCLAAITGRPALSAPLLEADGAPLGLSLLGPRDADLDVIARGTALAAAQV
jgi:amidase